MQAPVLRNADVRRVLPFETYFSEVTTGPLRGRPRVDNNMCLALWGLLLTNTLGNLTPC